MAAGLAALMLVPSGAWHHPSTDATFRGFDANLLYVSPSGGIDITPDTLSIKAAPGARPFVHLVTTPISYSVSFDAEVQAESPGSVPLRIELWSPATQAGYRIVFDSSGDALREQTVAGADAAPDLAGGTIGVDKVLGAYLVGGTYHVLIHVDQAAHAITSHITGPSALDLSSTVGRSDAPDLFAGFRPTLSLSASGDSGGTTARIANYAVALPSQAANTAESTVKVDDALAGGLSVAGWLASIAMTLLLVLVSILPRLRGPRTGRMAGPGRPPALLLAAAAVAAAAYVAGNMSLFGLGSLHFDVYAAKVWSYVAFKDGFGDLYYRTLLVPAAAPWLGVPVHEATFPYGFTKAYYYLAMGGLNAAFLGGGTSGFSFEQLLKVANVLFGLVDSILIFLIAMPLVSRRSAAWSAVLVGLNPAFLFVMSVWGSTESISLFFVLGSILLAERSRVLGAWLMLAAAAYTRPQMLVLAFLLGIVYLRKFGPARNATAIAWTVIVAFVFVGPLAIAISPSVPVDYVARTFAYHIGNGQADVAYLGISPGNYSVWTMPLLLLNGAHGLERMWSPSTLALAGGSTYGAIAAILSVGLLLVVGAVLLVSSRIYAEPGRYMVVVAFGMLGWLLVTPGVISRYLVYAVVLVILCRGVLSLVSYVGAVGVLSATALAGIYVQLALDFSGYSGGLNVLSPSNNQVSRVLFEILSSDRFVSLASISNFAVLVGLGVTVWSILRRAPATALAAAPTGV